MHSNVIPIYRCGTADGQSVGRALFRTVAFSLLLAFYFIELQLNKDPFMTTNIHVASSPQLRWDFWWRWMLMSLIGITIGTILYYLLPDALTHPQADENIWLEQPWRLAVMNAVYAVPIVLAQFLVLWNYVWLAWWWPTIILGSVIVIYPITISIFENLGWLFHNSGLERPAYLVWEISWFVWFFGFGGSAVYLFAQWIAMFRWTRNVRALALSFVVTSLGSLLVLRILALFSPGVSSAAVSDSALSDQLHTIVNASLYQFAIGGVLAVLIKRDVPSNDEK
jgi:hypothetical protein